MSEVFHTLSHIVGFCGEPHIKLIDLIPIYQSFEGYKKAFAYTLYNTWQNLIY